MVERNFVLYFKAVSNGDLNPNLVIKLSSCRMEPSKFLQVPAALSLTHKYSSTLVTP